MTMCRGTILQAFMRLLNGRGKSNAIQARGTRVLKRRRSPASIRVWTSLSHSADFLSSNCSGIEHTQQN